MRSPLLLVRYAGAYRLLLATLTTLAIFPPSFAAEPDGDRDRHQPLVSPDGRIIDRTLGEEEQIARRLEWFLASRRAGTRSTEEMAALRRLATIELGREIEMQSLRRSRGVDGPENFWVPKGPAGSHFGGWAFGDVAGRITAIAKDASGATLYAGAAAGGVWKSVNDGLSWSSIFDTAGTTAVGAIAIDPNNASVIWVGTGDYNTGCEDYFGIGLLRSLDGGISWVARNGGGSATLDDMSAFSSVIVDPRDSNHVVIGGVRRGCTSGSASNGGIYTSNDAGASWSKRLADIAIHEVAQDPINRDIWWAATSQGIYKSTNNAVTWTVQTASGLPSSGVGRCEIAIAPSAPNTVYALFASAPSGPEIWRTTNGGTSWTKQASSGNACDGQCSYNLTIRVHRTNPDIVYRGTVLLFKSTNGGVSWTDLVGGWGSGQKVHQDTHVLLIDPTNTEKFYVGTDGGLWKSEDAGASFVNLVANMNLTQFYAVGVDASDPETICGGAQDNSSLVRTTSDVWQLQEVTGDGFVCHIDPVDRNYAYITSYPSGGPAVYRSTTGVLGSFGFITGAGSGINSADRVNWVTPYILDPQTPATLLLGTQRIYRSTNHGTNWSPVGPGDMAGGSATVYALEFHRTNPQIAYAGTESGRIWRSVDNGLNWAEITLGLPSRVINDIGADPTDEARALAVVGGFGTAHLWQWNGGGPWTALGSGLPNVPANSVLMRSGAEVFVGTDIGVYRSTDGGLNFQPFMSGLPQGLVISDLKYNAAQNILTAGTYARGAWQVSLAPVGPIVLYDSIEQPLTEVDGDHDGNVEPGETWRVSPLLRNAGGALAVGVHATLRTLTAGVTIEAPSARLYGDIVPGGKLAVSVPYTFSVDPTFACGTPIVFDIVEIQSSNAPGSYGDRLGAFSVTVVDTYNPPIPSTHLDEDFDPSPTTGWTHERFGIPMSPNCFGITSKDEWKIVQKDAAHGLSYHCGRGPGSSYSNSNYAWLYYGGKDSLGGPGLSLPADAFTAQLSIVHWFSTEPGWDGGQVAIDAFDDNNDQYQLLTPIGGYPGILNSGRCNPLEGAAAFSGTSGGWTTSTFDLMPYIGKTVYLAFIFASDRTTSTHEGWYIDQVKVETQKRGAPICQTASWAGRVPPTVSFRKAGAGQIEATWGGSCNASGAPGQLYSIQAGDLNQLPSGSYTHAPLGDQCGRTSPSTFSPGNGNQYYLVVANVGGREGSAGRRSNSTERPQTSAICGARRVPACP